MWEGRTSPGCGRSCRMTDKGELAQLNSPTMEQAMSQGKGLPVMGVTNQSCKWMSLPSEDSCFAERLTWNAPSNFESLGLSIGQEAERCKNQPEWVGQVMPHITGVLSSALEGWNKMETFKGGSNIVSPGSWQASSCLSLASALLKSIFINYFHRNKYITYTLDDQGIWQPEKNYMSQEDNCTFFFLITVFLNLHPSPGFPNTVLRCHSALILGFLYPLER